MVAQGGHYILSALYPNQVHGFIENLGNHYLIFCFNDNVVLWAALILSLSHKVPLLL